VHAGVGKVSIADYTSDLEFFNPRPPSQWGVHEEESWQQRRAAGQAEWQRTHELALMIGDLGLLNFFLGDAGSVRWTAHGQT